MLRLSGMQIVGDRLESGIRVHLERALDVGPPWKYHGAAVTPVARFELSMALSADGAVHVDLAPGAPAGVAEKLYLLGRVLLKHALADGAPPPRRLVRWRAEP
jgi:hypothetical protein